MPEITVERVTQEDPRLGRQLVHDERSRGFALPTTVDKSTWRDKSIRIYDPIPNPNQEIGCCTGVDKCVTFNAAGNRVTGTVNKLKDAVEIYSLATTLDPWDGAYPPTDTGSSALAAAKAAQMLGKGGAYQWLFGGADQVVQTIMAGRTVSIGAWWYWDMFTPDATGKVSVSGGLAGGHQWTARGYWKSRDLIRGRCWWGSYRDFWISRADLDALLRDGGDANCQDVL